MIVVKLVKFGLYGIRLRLEWRELRFFSQCIHCKVTNINKGGNIFVSFMYASNL